MPRVDQSSVVLVTSSQPGVRESGSGFAVHRDERATYVATCLHVVRDWDAKEIQVNGRPANVIRSGEKNGIDLAILEVPRLDDVPPLPLAEFVRSRSAVYGYTFRHLFGEDYVRSRVEGKVSKLLSLQGKAAQRAIPAWEVSANDGYSIHPGNSGSPLIDAARGKVVGIISHAFGEGRSGIALSSEAVRVVWPEIARLQQVVGGESAAESPPEPPEPTDSLDPHKGRFGKRAEARGRKLEAALTDHHSDYFHVDLIVRSTDGSKLQGPARFFLHDSYPRPTIWVRQPDARQATLSLRDVYCYGVFTVGCQVRDAKGRWVGLELDLAKLAGLPKKFLAR